MTYSRTIEITAKDEKEARKLAEEQLQPEEEIQKHEVISAPTRGLFSFVGKQEYKIKYFVGAKAQEAELEKTKEKKESFEAQFQKENEAETEAVETEETQGDEDQDEDFEDLSGMPVKRPRRDQERDWAPRSGRRSSRGRDRDRDSRRSRRPRRHYDSSEEEFDIPARPRTEVPEDILNNELYSEMFDIVREVSASIGVENLELKDFICDGAWVIDATGDNVSQLIGKRGRTLDSLQYLMNIIYNKGRPDRTKIVLDAQGYREKRHRNLMMLAQRMQRKVLASGRQVELEPMSTLDRRTVHMALKDVEEIETFSRGVEPSRRVVIALSQKKRKVKADTDWQPLVVDENDGDEVVSSDSTAEVPMFMEEDV